MEAAELLWASLTLVWVMTFDAARSRNGLLDSYIGSGIKLRRQQIWNSPSLSYRQSSNHGPEKVNIICRVPDPLPRMHLLALKTRNSPKLARYSLAISERVGDEQTQPPLPTTSTVASLCSSLLPTDTSPRRLSEIALCDTCSR